MLESMLSHECFPFFPHGALSLPDPDRNPRSVVAYQHPSLLSSLNLPDLVWSLFHVVFLGPVCGLLSPLPTKGIFNVPLLGLSGTTWSYHIVTGALRCALLDAYTIMLCANCILNGRC